MPKDIEAARQGVGGAFLEWLESRPPYFMRDVIEDAVKGATVEWLNRTGPQGSARDDTRFTEHDDWYHRGPCCTCGLCGGNGCFVWNPNDPGFPEVHICETCNPMKRSA